jgi:hypothetical protein
MMKGERNEGSKKEGRAKELSFILDRSIDRSVICGAEEEGFSRLLTSRLQDAELLEKVCVVENMCKNYKTVLVADQM